MFHSVFFCSVSDSACPYMFSVKGVRLYIRVVLPVHQCVGHPRRVSWGGLGLLCQRSRLISSVTLVSPQWKPLVIVMKLTMV